MTYNQKKREYNIEYAKHKLKRVPLDLQHNKYDQIKEHVEATHETVNGFIKRAIDETIERDNTSNN